MPIDARHLAQQGYPEQDIQDYSQRYMQTPDDMIESYGGVIKDLTDTEKLLIDYEYKLQGMRKDTATGKYVDIPGLATRMSKAKSIEFVDMLRSIVNQNTHFSNFEERIITNILRSANYSINRWLMFQGEAIPLRYRPKISFEAMNLIIASLYKSNRGTILDWTKGSFRVAEDNRDNEPKSNMFMPWTWGRK